MADIDFTCAACGSVTSLSEYVNPEAATCRSCGKPLKVAHAVTAPQGPAAPRAAAAPAPVRGVFPLPESATARDLVEKRQKRMRRQRRIIAWSPSGRTILIAFVVVSAILCLLRYGILEGSERSGFSFIGMMCLLVGHVTIVVDAFADNTMHGLLCLFVPFYSLFYLFTQCDSWVLRLGIGILIPPFGLDAGLVVWKLAQTFFAWLQSVPISAT